MTDNVYWHTAKVAREDREKRNGHQAACIWFTGLSGSGKSTLAVELDHRLYERGIYTYVLDGDNIRHGLNKDLGFSDDDRKENIRRIGEVAKLFVDNGTIVMTAFISPFKEDREAARNLVGADRFIEVHVDCDLQTCMKRDPKGLYQKAIKGEVKEFTGISSPYEAPEGPQIMLNNSEGADLESNVDRVIEYLEANGILPPGK